MLLEEFQSIAKYLQADYERSRGIEHHGLKGSTRETAVATHYLRHHLPQKYSVSSGIVINAEGETSGQLDIVLYDQFNAPVLQDYEGNKVFFAEQVIGCIEVKSTLDGKEIQRIVESAVGFAKVAPDTPYFVFAYDAKLSAETIRERFQTAVDSSDERVNISAVVVLSVTDQTPFFLVTVHPDDMTRIMPLYSLHQPYALISHPTQGEVLLGFQLVLLSAADARIRLSKTPPYWEYARRAGFGKINTVSIGKAGHNKLLHGRASQILGNPGEHSDREVVKAFIIMMEYATQTLGPLWYGKQPMIMGPNGKSTDIELTELISATTRYLSQDTDVDMPEIVKNFLVHVRSTDYRNEGYAVIDIASGQTKVRLGNLGGLSR